MSTTISQGLTIPAGLADGQTAASSQVVALYQSLNAFVIPDTVGTFQQAFVDSVKYTVATGASQDWTVAVTKDKAIFFMISLQWSAAGAAPTYTLRVNAASVGSVLTMTNTAAADGLIVGFIGGHDTTDAKRPVVMIGMDGGTGTTLRAGSATIDLPNTDTTSVGLAVGGAGNTSVFKYVKLWREG